MIICSYCGSAQSMTKDHVIPLSIMTSGKRRGGEHGRGETIDACSTCNSLLGDKYILTKARRSMYLVEQYASRLLWYEDEQSQNETLDRIKSCVLAYEGFLLKERSEEELADNLEPEAVYESAPINLRNWQLARVDDRRRLSEAPLAHLLARSIVRAGDYALNCSDLLLLMRSGKKLPKLNADDRQRYLGLIGSIPSLLQTIANLQSWSEIENCWKRDYSIASLHSGLLSIALWGDKNEDRRASVLIGMMYVVELESVENKFPSNEDSQHYTEELIHRGGSGIKIADRQLGIITSNDRARIKNTRYTKIWMSKKVYWVEVKKYNSSDILLLSKYADVLPCLQDCPIDWAFFSSFGKRLEEVCAANSKKDLDVMWRNDFSIENADHGITALIFNQEINAKKRLNVAIEYFGLVQKMNAPYKQAEVSGPGLVLTDKLRFSLRPKDKARLKAKRFQEIWKRPPGEKLTYDMVDKLDIEDIMMLIIHNQPMPAIVCEADEDFFDDTNERVKEIMEAKSYRELTWLWRFRYGFKTAIEGIAVIAFNPAIDVEDKVRIACAFRDRGRKVPRVSGR